MPEYKRPSLTVDTVIFTIIEKELNILLIKRKKDPFKDCWAIPGGFVDYEEEIETAAYRELEEETALKCNNLQQIYIFGKPGRDPRGRTVSVVYTGFVKPENRKVNAGDDAKEAEWFNVKNLPELAFDHSEVINFVINNIKTKLENTTIVKDLLPEQFAIADLQEVYEVILDKSLDSGRFKCEIIKNGFLEKVQAGYYKFKQEIEFASRFY